MSNNEWSKVVNRRATVGHVKKTVAPTRTVTRKSPPTVTKYHPKSHAQKIDEATDSFVIDKVSHNLAQTIQQARVGKGWTRKELAHRVNVKLTVIADYETGKGIPDGGLLQKLSRALGVPLKKRM